MKKIRIYANEVKLYNFFASFFRNIKSYLNKYKY